MVTHLGRLSPRVAAQGAGAVMPAAKRGSVMSEVPKMSPESLTSESATCDVPARSEGASRRTVLRLAAAGGAGLALVGAQGVGRPFLAKRGLLSADGAFAATSMALADQLYIE